MLHYLAEVGFRATGSFSTKAHWCSQAIQLEIGVLKRYALGAILPNVNFCKFSTHWVELVQDHAGYFMSGHKAYALGGREYFGTQKQSMPDTSFASTC